MKTIQSLFVICFSIFCLNGTSNADPAKASVLIDNPTAKTVHYQLRWGTTGEWKSFTLQSGFETTHTKKYDPMGVPPPYVLFEQFSTFDGGASKKYKLRIGWDNNPQRYHFSQTNNKLDLFNN
jgi:hypothetical protein